MSPMSLRRTRRATRSDLVSGPVRTVRGPRDVRRLRAGEVAVVEWPDLDRATGEAFAAAGVTAVVNTADSSSGRYPNLGPQVLHEAGVLLIDAPGSDLLRVVRDGDRLAFDGGHVLRGEETLVEGRVLDGEAVDELLARARNQMAIQLETLTATSAEYLRREHDLLLEGVGIPELATEMAGREVVVVLPGAGAAAELKKLRRYLREFKPVLIGVNEGADALMQAGYEPAVLVGDPGRVADRSVRAATEIVLAGTRSGRETEDRLERLQRTASSFPAALGSEEAALLLADAGGARVVVTVGGFGSLEEFLDSARSGGATRYLTRLRLGPKLVDSRAIVGLHRARISYPQLILLMLLAMVLLGAAILTTPVGQDWWDAASGWVSGTWEELRT
ncbi:UNVERIFIED_CONTAM: hypothetical protein LK11_43045 [Mumia flava]|nr:putative cytokinetic ring protein SteA [Mumia flava]